MPWPSGRDLVSESGFRGGYQTVKRFVRKLRGNQPLQPRAVILTAPGEEAQVDYGTGPMVRDPQTGKYRRTRLFVLTLGYSRKAVRLLTFRSSSRIWAELHEKAFRRLGGCTRVVVLDNLREGVLVADTYDPTLVRCAARVLQAPALLWLRACPQRPMGGFAPGTTSRQVLRRNNWATAQRSAP
jgi:transposase